MIRTCFHKFNKNTDYPQEPPFDPTEIFPELLNINSVKLNTKSINNIYTELRNLFFILGLDVQNYGTKSWNPFKDFVKKGQTVLIKPNLVTHHHPQGKHGIFWTISHPSIIRVLLDYALIAVGPEGQVIIGDTPIENCDFQLLCEISGLQKMVDQLHNRGFKNLELLDFRTYQTIQYPGSKAIKINLPGDPHGYTDIDLCRSSFFQELEDKQGNQNYYTLGDHTVDHMNPKERKSGLSNSYHSNGRHIYRIPNTVLQSNFVISLAKLKTHKFSGVTLCLKNIIGICEGKQYLPHRRPGSKLEMGDSFPFYPSFKYVGLMRLKRAIYSIIGSKNSLRLISIIRKIIKQKPAHEIYSEPLFGDWHGNDTIWRTTLDLNHILMYADTLGFHPEKCKRSYLGIIDGVIGMDHEAPMSGLPVQSNIIIAGFDPISVDTLGCYLMGFDPRKIPTIANAIQCSILGDVNLKLDEVIGNTSLTLAKCSFVPTKGWKEYLLDPSMDYFKDDVLPK